MSRLRCLRHATAIAAITFTAFNETFSLCGAQYTCKIPRPYRAFLPLFFFFFLEHADSVSNSRFQNSALYAETDTKRPERGSSRRFRSLSPRRSGSEKRSRGDNGVPGSGTYYKGDTTSRNTPSERRGTSDPARAIKRNQAIFEGTRGANSFRGRFMSSGGFARRHHRVNSPCIDRFSRREILYNISLAVA